MSEVLKVVTINCETGEQTERPMTDEEIAERETAAFEVEKLEAQVLAKAEARQAALAKLAALGLTQEEIEAL